MYFIESPRLDAYFNMALEEYFFEKSDEFLILWRNKNAVVVGKYQNTAEEINAAQIRQAEVAVVRRLSGGGAMYQDTGNVNYTFIVNQSAAQADFSRFTSTVTDALHALGVPAESRGRNDLVADGRKISGAAQFSKGTRTLHHGTLLFDSDLGAMQLALNTSPEKMESKGIKSIRNRVTNIRSYLPADMDVRCFMSFLSAHLTAAYGLSPYSTTDSDISAVEKLA